MRRETFQLKRAKPYRKVVEVLAFRSKDPFVFKKDWGHQSMRAGAWVIIPLGADGRASLDIYGCDAGVFSSTYAPASTPNAHRYVKRGQVWAYRPGVSFYVDTILADPDGTRHTEVLGEQGGPRDWIVRNPSGETYVIRDDEFQRTYRAVSGTLRE